MEGERAGFREGQRAEIVHQTRYHARLVEDRLEMLSVRRVQAIEQRLEVALHDRERRSQLVRYVSEQPPTLLLARLEALAHRVERPREGPQLPRTARPHACAVVPGLDALRRVDQVTERDGERDDDDGENRQGHEDRGSAAGAGRVERVDEQHDERRDDERKEQERQEHEGRGAAHEAPAHAPALGWSACRPGFSLWPPRRAVPRRPGATPPRSAATFGRHG